MSYLAVATCPARLWLRVLPGYGCVSCQAVAVLLCVMPDYILQDKVIEFARMNKQELLLETERAVSTMCDVPLCLISLLPLQVGPEELCQYHDQLKTLKKRHSQTQENLKKIEKKLEDLKRENNLLQRDVERFRNKEKFEKDIKHLTYKRYWLVSVLSACKCRVSIWFLVAIPNSKK